MNPTAFLGQPRLAPVLIAVLVAGCATTTPTPISSPSSSGSAGRPGAVAAAPPAPAGTAPGAPPVTPLRVVNAAGPSASGVPPGTPQPASPPPGGQPAFAVVIKDAKKSEGLFTLYQKDEKVWIELKPEDFNKPFF
ncbi:MAG: DUF5118 domain-containing protein, partial [Bacteriovorax sp.]|nr:DUF5118 domain-containing protein [Rhizobacter sp.]